MVSTRTRVFVVDDLPSMRRPGRLLHEIDGVEVVGRPATGIRDRGNPRPAAEIVLLDFQLDGGRALDVLRAAPRRCPTPSSSSSPTRLAPYRRACTKAGAQYFLDKSSEFGRIGTMIAGLEPAPH